VATIFDVAAEAGVSHQTVSRTLNGDPTVRAATRERVQAAVERLGYRRNAAARALASRRTRTIGLITVGLPLYGPSSITNSFNAAVRRSGWDVSIAALDQSASEVRHAADALLGQDVQALVVVGPTPSVTEGLRDLSFRVPLLTTVRSDVPGAHWVGIDNEAGAVLAVRHLAGLGHRSVVHVAGPADWTEAQDRERGWRRASSELGLALPEVLRGDWTAADGYRIGRRIAEEGGTTAVFSANDQMALGLLAAFSAAGVRVPEDISLVGFDDIPEAAFFLPPLTTVRQDFAGLGERLTALLETLLAGSHPADPPAQLPDLVLRRSTGRIPTGPRAEAPAVASCERSL
jgi:DNA-binding LacI/PurR family transcriptional regulator